MNNFDWKFYIGHYGDLRRAGINTEQKALEHWVKFGKNENRVGCVGMKKNIIKKTIIKKPIISTMKINDIKNDIKHLCPFDWVFYSAIYPDIKRSGLTTQTQVNNHWNTEGKKNGRVCCSNKMTEIFNNNLNKIKNEEMKYIKKNINTENKINILIRTSNRPDSFTACIESILTQNYKNYNIIVSYDKIESLEYLKKYDNITYHLMNINNPNKYKFNLYCNFLMDQVVDGYIMFLDDDDILTHNNVLSIINDYLRSEHTMLIWKFMRPDKLIYPKDTNNILLGSIDTTSFCFHSKFKSLARWGDKQCGDFHFITQLLKKKRFNITMLNYILTRTSYNNKIANFGN
jgi:hypothetical protein